MLDHKETVEMLRLAQQQVRKISWALSIHLPQGMDGGAHTVEREAADINGRIENAIDRILSDAHDLA